MGTIKDLEKRVDGHESRISMLEHLAISAKSDRKWMITIGAAMVSGIVALGYMQINTSADINFIAGEHRTLSQKAGSK